MWEIDWTSFPGSVFKNKGCPSHPPNQGEMESRPVSRWLSDHVISNDTASVLPAYTSPSFLRMYTGKCFGFFFILGEGKEKHF